MLSEPEEFEAVPRYGEKVTINGAAIVVGNRRMLPAIGSVSAVSELEAQGKTTLIVTRDNEMVGVLGAADTLRLKIPQAVSALQRMRLREIRILTGDNERVAAAVAGSLGIAYHAGLLPEDKEEEPSLYTAL
jgi:Cu+-exporting ATPase